MTLTVLATPTTKTKRRDPLRALDMAASQAARPSAPAPSRKATRSSARTSLTQEQPDTAHNGNGAEEKKSKAGTKRSAVAFDEDVEGFQFTRITKNSNSNSNKKQKPSVDAIPEVAPPAPENPAPQPSPRRGRPRKKKVEQKPEEVTDPKKKTAEGTSTRRTRGAAKTAEQPQQPEPEPEPASTTGTRASRKRDDAESVPVPLEKKRRKGRPSRSNAEEQTQQNQQQGQQEQEQEQEQRNGFQSPPPPQQSGTATIALPMADTPVIQRNKEMRGNRKSGKGDRRSSLGMRGRRASSLIDSGASNALPHKEVDTAEFYKHIAADLPEPRRMRQLLTWCATRAVGDKPTGSRASEASARLAARVIQEEVLKEFSSNSELSDWFSREDTQPRSVVVQKPNPKNTQNSDKIKELEEQIQRLQRERQSLNALLRAPTIAPVSQKPTGSLPPNGAPEPPSPRPIDLSLLDPSQQQLSSVLAPTPAPESKSQPEPDTDTDTDANANANPETDTDTTSPLPPITPSAVAARLSRITGSLGPTLDAFAAGMHDVELFRATGDRVASQVLRICAERLDERDARNAMRRLALEGDEGKKALGWPHGRREDLGVVLGALSRVERR